MQVTILRRLSKLLCVTLLFSACALQPPSPPGHVLPRASIRGAQLHGQLVELHTQRLLSLDAFVAATATAHLLAVGEEHYHPDIQAFELRLLQALAQRHPQRLALAMEFLERDMQPELDACLAETSAAETLRQRLKTTAAFNHYYLPLIQYACQAGIPILAMNLPRRLARQVVREGLQTVLENMRADERSYLPATLFAITPEYRAYFRKEAAQAHPLPAEQTERFLEAAHLKDETMADSLSTFLERTAQHTVLAIAGRFHFDYGLAIPARLQERSPTIAVRRLTTMSIAEDEEIDLQHLASTGMADYVWFAPPPPDAPSEK